MEAVQPILGGAPPSLAGLRRGELHLWCAAPDPAAAGALARLLPEPELARYRALAHEPRRSEYLRTRALVRQALSAYAETPPPAWRFREGPHGRPELDPPSPLRFNLSNCDGLVTCLVALEREVGVDVEPAAHGADALALAPAILSPAEQEVLAGLASPRQREAHALTLWTLKESYLKARGLGLSLPVGALTFTLAAGAISLTAAPQADPAAARWSFASFELGPHRIAVTAGPGPDLRGPARLVLYPDPGVDSTSGSKWSGV